MPGLEFLCKENHNEENFSNPILFWNSKGIFILNTWAHQNYLIEQHHPSKKTWKYKKKVFTTKTTQNAPKYKAKTLYY